MEWSDGAEWKSGVKGQSTRVEISEVLDKSYYMEWWSGLEEWSDGTECWIEVMEWSDGVE